MKQTLRSAWPCLLTLTWVTKGLAHPGHGNETVDGYHWLHYLTELPHLIIFGIATAIVFILRFWFIRYLRKAKAEKKKSEL